MQIDTIAVSKLPEYDILVMCGDFNAKVGISSSYAPEMIGQRGLGVINDDGAQLIDMCAGRGQIVVVARGFPTENPRSILGLPLME